MRLLLIILIIVAALANNVRADDSKMWLELGLGGTKDFIATTVNIKYGTDHYNWAIEFGQYSNFTIFSHVEDRETGIIIYPQVETIGITKNWTSFKKFGYLEAGIGLGVAKGIWASNCAEAKSTGGFLIFSDQVCDSSNGYNLGVPIHISAAFGKYVGIGVTLKAFITNEDTHAGLMITIPLGDFTN